MARRIAAAVVLAVTMMGTVAPLAASTRPPCPMCGGACHCPPRAEGAGCRMSHSSGAVGSAESAGLLESAVRPALLPGAVEVAEASNAGRLLEVETPLPPSLVSPPRHRPPAASS